MMDRFRTLIEWAGSNGSAVLVAALVVVAGLWGFIHLAGEVREGETQQFDEWAVRALRKPNNPAEVIGPMWVTETQRDLTALGGVTVLGLVTIVVAGYLALARKFRAMCLVLAATASGLLVSTLLKGFFARPRPEVVPPLSYTYTSSFPSGHSMLSAVVYLTLGTLLMRLTPIRAVKLYVIVVALTVTFLVGVSRVFMAAHYPTDVLAGWTAGLVWALLCWLVARYLQRRRMIERDDDRGAPESSP